MIGGHGHVTPRPDGAKARCGGPGVCAECSREQAAGAPRSDPERNRYTVTRPVPHDADPLEAAQITNRLRDELERMAADNGDVLVGTIDLTLDRGAAFSDTSVLTASADGAPRDEPAKPSAWRPKVLADFDGVIHRYSRGWSDGSVYDDAMPGAKAALEAMTRDGYEVVIFSTRDAAQIRDALSRWGFPPYRVTNVKEAAVAQIDDRAIRFVDWTQAAEDLRRLYPVNSRG